MKKTEQPTSSKVFHISTIIVFLIIICGFAGTIIFKYQVEGETNAVFDVSKILVVSTAEAILKENPSAKWDCKINQNNDLYITIEKNKKKNDIIKSVTINNIQILQSPSVGNISLYKPAEKGLFKCDNQYKIDNELVYYGSKNGYLNNLEVSNQGGTVIIRLCNENVGEFVSNEDDQILQDGKLLQKSNTTLDQLNAKVQLDILIETEKGFNYKATVDIDLPVGNIIEEGTCTKEINKDEIVLKRN